LDDEKLRKGNYLILIRELFTSICCHRNWWKRFRYML